MMPIEYDKALTKIESALSKVDFQYTLDMSLTIGGDLVEVTHPTGLRSPKVFTEHRVAKGQIFLNTEDVLSHTKPNEFLRDTIYNSMVFLFSKISKKDKQFDLEKDLTALAFLLD